MVAREHARPADRRAAAMQTGFQVDASASRYMEK
jgi:hypothetical protein